MGQLVTLLLSSFGVSFLLTPVVRLAATRWGLVDSPDGRRKIHARPIPVAGGVAVFLSAMAVLFTGLLLHPDGFQALGDQTRVYLGLFIAVCIIAVVGVVDDSRGLRGRHKLAGQAVAVAVLIAAGLRVDTITLFHWTLPLGVLAIPFTMFWLLGAINALNLIDGLDGMLGSVGAIITFTIGCIAVFNQQWPAAAIAFALSGSIIGFLVYNFPPATIFMGDCGSMLIGLVVGALAIQCSLKGPATVALATPMALLVIPIFDSSAAIIRRKLTGRSIYTTDRGHLHHVLIRHGLSNRRVLILVAGLCALAGLGAWFSLFLKSEFVAVLAAGAVVLSLMASRLFGHAEFLLIKERLMAVVFTLRHGSETGRVHQTQVRLQGSADWNELWRDLTACGEQLNLKTLCLDLNAPSIHEGYHARWDRRLAPGKETSTLWKAEIPLAVNGQPVGRLEVVGLRGRESVWEAIATLAKIGETMELAIQNLTRDCEGSHPAPEPAAPPRLRLEHARTA